LDFYFLRKGTSIEETLDRLGEPDKIWGSGVERYQYNLADDRVIELVFFNNLQQAWILEKDGTRRDYFEIVGEAEVCEEIETTKTLPELILSLKAHDPTTRKEGALALGCLGSEAKEAIPALTQALRDEEVWVCDAVAWALGQIGPEAIPSLIQALEDPGANVRIAAAWGLGHMDSEAENAIPALIQALGDENESVSAAAGWALGQIGPVAIPSLVQILSDENQDESLRKAAVLALGQTGEASEEAIPFLILALDDESKEVNTAAQVALWYITGHPVLDVDWWKEWWKTQQ
jgi:HEAT repeat protein